MHTFKSISKWSENKIQKKVLSLKTELFDNKFFWVHTADGSISMHLINDWKGPIVSHPIEVSNNDVYRKCVK